MTDKLLIDGIEILYYEYHANTFFQILFWAVWVLAIATTLIEIGIIIYDKEWDMIWLPAISVIAFGLIILFLRLGYPSYTVYHVKLDDTVPYKYIVNNFSNIQHEGEDCYRIIIDEGER